MATIDQPTEVEEAASGPVIELRQGYRGKLTFFFHDGTQDRNAADVSSTTVSLEADWNIGGITPGSITNMRKIPMQNKLDLTNKWAWDSDLTTNPGLGYMTIDEDVEWSEHIDINAAEVPILTIYMYDTTNGETRTRIFNIGWRRGKPSSADGG